MFAAPQAVPAAHAGGIGELAHVVIALLIVLGVLLVLATLVRRARSWGLRAPKHLEVLADVPVGAKERAVLLRVGGMQLLLGVAPGRVSALHVLPQPLEPTVPAAGDTAPAVSFQALLRRSLGV